MFMMFNFFQITHFVIDEAHCIISWGGSDFRPAYKKLGLLRVVFSTAKVVALTATATKQGQQQIMDSLNMINPTVILESQDRYYC